MTAPEEQQRFGIYKLNRGEEQIKHLVSQALSSIQVLQDQVNELAAQNTTRTYKTSTYDLLLVRKSIIAMGWTERW